MALNKTDVEKIAHLSRLHLEETETDEITNRLTNILALIDEMQSVTTDDVSPLAHPFDAVQRLRDDEVTETDQRETLQSIAPSTEKGLYLVPKVIE